MVAKQAIKPTRGERAQLRDLVRRGRALQSPLVPFVEFLDAGGDVWVLREFDSGVPLSKVALNSPLSHRQAAGTAAACLRALAQLYAAGLCHGRVHGGNVFVEPDGAIRVVDAGIGAPRSRRGQQARWADDMKATAALVYTVWPDWEYEAGRLIYDLLEAGRMGNAAAASQGLELLAASLPPAENKPSADLALAALGVRLLDGEPARAPGAPAPPAVVTTAEPEEVGASAAAPTLKAWTAAPLERPVARPAPAPPKPSQIAQPPALPHAAAPPSPPDIVMPPSPPDIIMPPSPPPVEPAPPAAVARPAARPARPPHPQGAVYRWVPAPARGARRERWALNVEGLPIVASLRASLARILHDTAAGRFRRRPVLIGAAAAAGGAVVLGVAIGHAVAPTWPPAVHSAPKAPPLQDAGGSHAQPLAPPPAQGSGTLQPAAPASAGFVRQVELEPQGACAAGGQCTLKSVLMLQGPHTASAITWDVVAVDRCTGAQSVLSSSQSSLDPSWTQVWAADQFSLSSTHPTWLYAVVESPYRVASAPLEIDGSAACAPRT